MNKADLALNNQQGLICHWIQKKPIRKWLQKTTKQNNPQLLPKQTNKQINKQTKNTKYTLKKRNNYAKTLWLSSQLWWGYWCEYHHHHHHPVAPSARIVHCFWRVFRATSRNGTELLYVGSSWSTCLCSSMWRGAQEYVIWALPYFSNSVLHVWFV